MCRIAETEEGPSSRRKARDGVMKSGSDTGAGNWNGEWAFEKDVG